MRRYSTVLFDLFDTLVRFDRSRLPAIEVDGREVRSSVARLYPAAVAALPGVTLPAFYDALLWSYREAERRREVDHREVPARERFGLCFARLGFQPDRVPTALTDHLLGVHMQCLAEVAEPMPDRQDLLDWLGGRYRLGVVSNFDYTPTVEHILARGGIRDRFETVVVSDAVGWRKPSAAIFEVALRRLGVGATDCLFVGDRPELDVAGAKGVGMDVAWLNVERGAFPPELPVPDYTLDRLGALRTVLEGRQIA
jgi:HAD superfamily hydrolase (TIGR01509 family)